MIEANVTDAALQYDNYYEGGKESLYNQRFGKKRVTLRESSILQKIISHLIKDLTKKQTGTQPLELKILDFGCGDGRLFEVIQQIAASKIANKVKFKFVGYDISKTGLEEFRKNLIDERFHETLAAKNTSYEASIYSFSKLVKNNVEISLIHSTTSNLEEVKLHTGYSFNLIMCMFGVLSHIPKRENRIEVLKMFNELLALNGQTLISVPTGLMFQNEQKLYNNLRKNCLDNSDDSANKLGMATEAGDLYYKVMKDNRIINNFYHVYNTNELYSDLIKSDFILKSTGVYCVKHIYDSTKNNLINYFDNFLAKILSSKIFSSKFQEKIVKYLVFVAGNNQNI